MINLDKMLDWVDTIKSRTKFTETQLMDIWRMRVNSKIFFIDIAKKFNVSRTCVSQLFFSKKQLESRKKDARKSYNNNLEKIKERSNERARKNKDYIKQKRNTKKGLKLIKKNTLKRTIKNNIKYEVIKTPEKKSKSTWEGIGEWSKNADFCIECNTTVYKHYAKGICIICYQRLQRQNLSEKQKEEKRKRERYWISKNKNRIKKLRIVRYELSNKIYNQVQKGEIATNPKINNLLENYKLLN